MSSLIWDQRPTLHRPVMIAAFEGWNDAGEAASGAVAWMRQRWAATQFARLDPEQYIDFQSSRPAIELRDGVIRNLTWPTIEFHAGLPGGGRNGRSSHDVVLVTGPEPNLHWRSFCTDVLAVASETGCEMVITLGALLADTPHTRPLKITGVTADTTLADGLGLERSSYEGPTGIVGVLIDASRKAELAPVSLWAPIPHYVSSAPNPKATMALLDRLEALLGIDTGSRGLAGSAQEWEDRVSEAVADDPDTAVYVHHLEERADATEVVTSDLADLADLAETEMLPTGDALAEEFERYLREGDDSA